jgi:hypothetical protein
MIMGECMTVGDFAARPVPAAARRFVAETVHAAPVGGLSFSGCCDRTATEFSPYDRISRNPEEVSCGRLSWADERILAGQPFVSEHRNS